MLIIPAIDLKDGKCVRLRQGKADEATVYSDDPIEMARHWEGQGAEYLHVVDLDGAFEGRPMHRAVIAGIAGAIDIPVEVGGGLREAEHIRALLDCGVARCIVGTRACSEPEILDALVAEFAERLVVGIDARDGMVQVKGWVETTGVKAVDLAGDVNARGVQTIIYTDTATDGMLTGPNIAAVDQMCASVNCGIIASGGITSCADIISLNNLKRPNLIGAIVGKALYEGSVTLGALQNRSD